MSPRRSTPAPAPATAPAPASRPAVEPEEAPRRSHSQAWMVTFTDLVALMLTFFVLLFAMSQIEQRQWQALVHSLAQELDQIPDSTEAKPAIDFHIDKDVPIPGTDLDYLAPVVLQQIGAQRDLARSVIRRLPDRIVISLPGALLYPPGSAELRPEAGEIVFAIGGVLRNLNNIVEIEAHSDPSAPSADTAWGLSLTRAMALSARLSEAGYPRGLLARGFGDTRPGELEHVLSEDRAADFASRIDIVIRDQAQGTP